jgi:UDP:flavonoid glycosyltransferase YjiC (YdhE family)
MEPLQAIVVGLGSAGDVHPNVGLALALRKRGHGVILVAGAVFRPLAQRLGLDFFELLTEEEYDAAIRDPDLWHPVRSFSVVARRLILPGLRVVYDIIEKNFKPGRTVVAAPGLAFGARIAQEKLGVPLATVHLQPIMLRSAIQPACFGFPDIVGHLPRSLRKFYFRAADRFFIDPLLAEQTNAFRAEVGLPPVRRLFDRWFHSPQRVIGLFPDWFAPPAPDWPPNVALTGFPLWDERDLRSPSPELEEFLAAGDPPLVFTAGSAMVQAKQFFHVSVEVCRAAGRRGLLLTQFPEQLPAVLPSGVRQFDYVPFSMVLPRCAALIHHGGIGTTAQALAAGLPQLVVPMSHDQPDNAVRIRRLGVGDFVLPGAYTKARVIEKLDRVMSPAVKDNCQRQAADLAGSQSLEQASNLIEALATA